MQSLLFLHTTANMSGGIALKDLRADESDDLAPDTRPDTSIQAQIQAPKEHPTASHALAMADHDEKGLAQLGYEGEVQDLGWNEPGEKIPAPLVGGLPNEELWILLRRFNKVNSEAERLKKAMPANITQQMYHVKEYPHFDVPGNIDLNIADEEEFSPDKLRSNFERLYMTIGIGLFAAVKHVMRIRSWRETRRTSVFCVAYTIAWVFDLIMPLVTLTLVILLAYEPSRAIIFPPAPIALVSAKTGGLQKPKAGVLGSTDSATGAPENHKGEAVEAEASNFVNSIAQIALSSATGKHPQGEPSGDADGDSPNERVPDPTAMAVTASQARASDSSSAINGENDKSKIPMDSNVEQDASIDAYRR